MGERVRLDQLIVRRGLAPSRERAQALILAGDVRVNGRRADRSAAPVDADADLAVEETRRYASRGGEKLAAALDELGLGVSGRTALDLGSSTGGFTDVLLQRGARRVYAVDVGKGQLDWRLRNDEGVVVMEGVNARMGFHLPEKVDLLVADLSFISLRLAVPPSFRHLAEAADALVLVKPQFEAGREAVGKGGVVRDVLARASAVVAVAERFAADGVVPVAIVPSRVRGREGNLEIFLHCRVGGEAMSAGELQRRARAASEDEARDGDEVLRA
ncbi:MAG: TlyA family RNA methyltransferase [Chloroflexota bacterium]|nr:TlyA family RNA methyltransferase [Chloroflexota bacterium]MDE3101562.1 TlyA family RNA methyltransferase [Chloroflexota bacterium]